MTIKEMANAVATYRPAIDTKYNPENDPNARVVTKEFLRLMGIGKLR